MALIDKASLLMVPSTYEDGTLYNVLPSGNKAPDETGSHNGYDQTRADFTFSRGSNLAATRVNADGLIEKGRENLLTYSNDFDQWSDTTIVLTSGQTGYDGSSDAWLMAKNGSNSRVFRSVTCPAISTISVYAKANASNYLRLRIDTTNATTNTFFDLVNGSIDSTTYSIDTNIESVGNGWYRCSVTPRDTATIVRLYPSEQTGTTETTGSIFIQDSQAEKGLVATDYIETGATTATAGVLENTPRIDYSSGAGALLLEPQRTNVITQSEYFGAWNGFRTDLSANSATSPEGISNAYSMVPNTDNNTHFIYFNTSESAVDYSFSLFAKSNGQQWIQLAKGGGGYANFDLTNGVKGNYGTDGSSAFTDSKIEDYGNGWYRITAYYTSVGGASNIGIAAISSDVTGRYQSFAGNGTSGYYIYGAQLESSASYESSYVPTYGSAVTRGADIVDGKEDSSLYNDSEGVLFVEFSALADSGRDNQWRFLISDGSNGNRVQIGLPNATNNLYASCIAGGVTSADMTHTLNNASSNHKVAIKYKANDFAMYVDGVEVDTDTSGSTPTGLDIFDFYRTPNNNNYVEANVKQVIYFDEALSDSELATLTTL